LALPSPKGRKYPKRKMKFVEKAKTYSDFVQEVLKLQGSLMDDG
jgi:hypothetical protein